MITKRNGAKVSPYSVPVVVGNASVGPLGVCTKHDGLLYITAIELIICSGTA